MWHVVAVAAAASASVAAPASAPEALADGFVSAWNAHDVKRFEVLYTPDAIWVPIAEERTRGRDAIIAEFAKIHEGKGWAVRTTIARKGAVEVHRVKPDVATVFFHMDFIVGGRPIAGMQRAMILVAVRGRDG
jgi:uncharacterized protein (TIGR02246 family)